MYLLWFAMGYQLMDALQVSAAGCLRGMQDTQAPMWITLMAYWVIAFPIGLYLARYTHWGVAGVAITLKTAEALQKAYESHFAESEVKEHQFNVDAVCKDTAS